MMELFGYGLLIFLGFLCVFALVNRICSCIEHCATVRAYGHFLEESKIKPEEFKVGFTDKNS